MLEELWKLCDSSVGGGFYEQDRIVHIESHSATSREDNADCIHETHGVKSRSREEAKHVPRTHVADLGWQTISVKIGSRSKA